MLDGHVIADLPRATKEQQKYEMEAYISIVDIFFVMTCIGRQLPRRSFVIPYLPILSLL